MFIYTQQSGTSKAEKFNDKGEVIGSQTLAPIDYPATLAFIAGLQNNPGSTSMEVFAHEGIVVHLTSASFDENASDVLLYVDADSLPAQVTTELNTIASYF